MFYPPYNYASLPAATTDGFHTYVFRALQKRLHVFFDGQLITPSSGYPVDTGAQNATAMGSLGCWFSKHGLHGRIAFVSYHEFALADEALHTHLGRLHELQTLANRGRGNFAMPPAPLLSAATSAGPPFAPVAATATETPAHQISRPRRAPGQREGEVIPGFSALSVQAVFTAPAPFVPEFLLPSKGTGTNVFGSGRFQTPQEQQAATGSALAPAPTSGFGPTTTTFGAPLSFGPPATGPTQAFSFPPSKAAVTASASAPSSDADVDADAAVKTDVNFGALRETIEPLLASSPLFPPLPPRLLVPSALAPSRPSRFTLCGTSGDRYGVPEAASDTFNTYGEDRAQLLAADFLEAMHLLAPAIHPREKLQWLSLWKISNDPPSPHVFEGVNSGEGSFRAFTLRLPWSPTMSTQTLHLSASESSSADCVRLFRVLFRDSTDECVSHGEIGVFVHVEDALADFIVPETQLPLSLTPLAYFTFAHGCGDSRWTQVLKGALPLAKELCQVLKRAKVRGLDEDL